MGYFGVVLVIFGYFFVFWDFFSGNLSRMWVLLLVVFAIVVGVVEPALLDDGGHALLVLAAVLLWLLFY